jgi:hypothetical protein
LFGLKYEMGLFPVVKEREMEIGYPTDVKHVAHVGWDGPSGNGPSWVWCLYRLVHNIKHFISFFCFLCCAHVWIHGEFGRITVSS